MRSNTTVDGDSTVHHAPSDCIYCNAILDPEKRIAWTGWHTIDIAENSPQELGIFFTYTKHILYEVTCECGHCNRREVYRAAPDPLWPKANITEWRLVGPRLASWMAWCSKRQQMSSRRIKEFLSEVCKLELSVGTIDKAICEAGRSVAPLKEELIRDIVKATLAYVDETSWEVMSALFWLWVFKTVDTVLFEVGKRDRSIIANLLFDGRFKGKIMADGWVVYREFINRLRCWAHLIRKACGLAESHDLQVATVGKEMLELFV